MLEEIGKNFYSLKVIKKFGAGKNFRIQKNYIKNLVGTGKNLYTKFGVVKN